MEVFMRLELATFPVKEVRFDKETRYHQGLLEIDKEEVLAPILSDPKILSADLELAFPNTPVRIVRIRDVVEPRVKISGRGTVFPGVLGPPETVGEGRTHRLSGVTVMASAEYKPTILSGVSAQNAGMVDMWGPGALWSPFASLINLVLVLKLVDTVTEVEAHASIQQAEFKLAQRLAETTRGHISDETEIFDLSEVDPSLPKVVYILTCLINRGEPVTWGIYYGLPIRESLSTFLHPNELLDGALTADARRGDGMMPNTWDWMNNPVVLRLLREHGKQLNFLGVILQRTPWENEFGKQVGANCSAQIAKVIGADGAIITRTNPSGNNLVDLMLIVQACEKKGVRTVLITPEHSGAEGTELPLLFSTPEATAIVSTGNMNRGIDLPAPARVIGCRRGEMVSTYPQQKPFSPWEALALERIIDISGGVDWLGYMHHTCVPS